VHLNDPVDQNAAHSLSYLRLVIHVLELRLIVHFSCHKISHDISCELSHILWVFGIIIVTFIDSLLQMNFTPPLEVLIDALEFGIKPLALLPLIIFLPFVHFFFRFLLDLDILDT
jgi:hypothetical protein